MEKNLKEEQTVPFLDQIMVLQKAHIAQRNEDSAVIEQLEHTNRVLKSEINNRQTLKFSKNDDNGDEEFFTDNESKISILNDSLILSEQRTEQAERSLLFLTAKLGMRDDDLIIANDSLSKNRKDIRTLKSKIALLNTDLEYSRITIDQNKTKINSIENDNMSLNTILTNQKKMLFEKDTTLFQMSENSSLAEMKVHLMITVIRAEIKFMNLLLEDSRSIDFNILSRELGVLNGLAGTGSDEISTIICDFNIQNNKMFVNMREKKENINEIIRLNKSMTVSCDKNTHALELNEILIQHDIEIIKLNERYNTLNNQLKDTERLRVMKEEKDNGEIGQYLYFLRSISTLIHFSFICLSFSFLS